MQYEIKGGVFPVVICSLENGERRYGMDVAKYEDGNLGGRYRKDVQQSLFG